MPRKRAPGIPLPEKGQDNSHVILALKDAVEVLLGQRKGSRPESAVTWQELVDLELIEAEQIPRD